MGLSTFSAQYDSSDPVENARLAAADIKRQTAGKEPAQVIFFGARNYDHATLAAAMRDAFPGADTFGCASSGEMIGTAMIRKSVVAMAFDKGFFEFFDITTMRRLNPDGSRADPGRQVRDAFAHFESKLGRPMDSLEHDKYVGFVFADALHYHVEPVLDRAGDLTSVPFMGGIAGDDGQFVFTPVFCNGESFTDGLVMALAKPSGRFGLMKTQGLELLDRTFTVTGSDEENRLVTHLDGRPAATVYSEAVGAPEEKMEFLSTFSVWPFGLMVGDEPFLRVALERTPDGSLRFLNAVPEGMRLRLARSDKILPTTEKAFAEIRGRLGSVSAVLHVNCISRHQDLDKAGECEAFGNIFAGCVHAGFASHGEVYIALANETSTMLVFA